MFIFLLLGLCAEGYREMLGSKLLAKTNYESEWEIRTLELLKLRFGEGGLHSCEIMLKDIADSKRTNLVIEFKDMRAMTSERL